MRRLTALFVLILAACSTTTTTPAPEPAVSTAPAAMSREDIARALIGNLAAGKATDATAHFDATMKEQLTADRLSQVWSQITGQLGSYAAIRSTSMGTEQGYDVLTARLGFARGELDAKVVFNAENQVAGLFFVPAGSGAP